MKRLVAALSVVLALVVFTHVDFAHADEGMWTFHNPPIQKIKEAYGFDLTPAWLEHVRLSSVRLAGIGSASFVSPDGLILTNHHVAAECIQGISTAAVNYMRDGFGTHGVAEPTACPGLEAQVLVETRDVTRRVLDAVPAGASDEEGFAARKAVTAKIESECANATEDLCEVVSLYQGGEYWVYVYKTYKDVRLVWAPEGQAALFGGDPDNFNYPRYSLDASLLRAYDKDGAPAKTPNHLTVAPGAYKDGDLVFSSGHPSSSGRFYTYAQLEFLRDHLYPMWQAVMERSRRAYLAYGAKGEEQARRAQFEIGMDENFIKVAKGYRAGLNNPDLMAKSKAMEDELRAKVAADPDLAASVGDPWTEIAEAQQKHEGYYERFRYVRLRGSTLFYKALQIALLTAEVEKPNGERLEEYRDSALKSLKHDLYSPAPIYADMEEAVLADRLALMKEKLGDADPAVVAALGSASPAKSAAQLTAKTKLYDPDARKALVDKGRKAVEKSKDPAVRLALAVEPYYRELRHRYETEVEEVEARAGERIARARFAIWGREQYPDTTFTLRMSFGKVAGYMDHGYAYPPRTTFYGLFDRAAGFGEASPWDLPPMWAAAKDKLNLATGYNVVTTLDTFPGNSGSPIVNAKGELIGLLFDGNLPGLETQFVYDEVSARSIQVDVDAVLEALRAVYGRADLANEMLGH